MKVIFLDIDWVLIRFWNTAKIRKTRADKWDKWWLITNLDDDLVKNLVNIVIQTSAKIVISSSWRRNRKLMWLLRDQFYNYEIKNKNYSDDLWRRVISKTPHSLNHWRWNEILHWINWHNESCKNWDHVKKWVVIDDDSFDMKSINRLWKFVHTKTHEWLTEEKMNECIEILNGSVEPIYKPKLEYLASNER